MIPDDDTEDEGNIEFYEPMPLHLGEDDCVLFDQAEFAEQFDAHAVQFKGGDLWVLLRETLEWVKVEPKKTAKARPFKSVQ